METGGITGILLVLFGGLGTAVLTHLVRQVWQHWAYRRKKVQKTTVVTPRKSEPSVIGTHLWESDYSFLLPKEEPIRIGNPGDYCGTPPMIDGTVQSTIRDIYKDSLGSSDFQFGVSPILGSSESSKTVGSASKDSLSSIYNLDFDRDLTNLVKFGEDAGAAVASDRLLYVDKKQKVFLASKYDAKVWEQAEFKRTDNEVFFRLRKKNRSD